MAFKNTSTLRKQLLAILLAIVLPGMTYACDGSGYIINDLIDNGDGTFTIDLTILVAGGDFPGGINGGTQGFYFGTNAPGGIVDVQPPSLTSQNGTTLNADINGGQVDWGDPDSGPFFVAPTDPTQSFNVLVTVSGEPSTWFGGGMEENFCGPADNDGAAGEYEGCFSPTIDILLAPSPVCEGQAVNVSALVTGANVTVNWSNGMAGTDITIFPSSSITLVATADNGCEPASDQVFIEVNPLPALEPLEPVEVCEGEPVALTAVAQNEDFISWSNGQVGNPIIFEAAFSELITVTATNACGSVSENVPVTVNPEPLLFITEGDQEICEGDSAYIEADFDFENSFAWSTGATSEGIAISPDTTATYTATASNECETLTEEVTVTVNQLPEISSISEAQAICLGDSVSLDASALNAAAPNWSNGSTGDTILVAPDTTTNYSAVASNNCGADTAAVEVAVSSGPALLPIAGDTAICPGDTATLQVSVEEEDSFSWSTGQTDTIIQLSPAATDTITATASNECGTVDTSFVISILSPPALSVVEGEQDICEGDTIPLTISPAFSDSILWSTAATDSSISVSPVADAMYAVTLVNACGEADTSFDIGVTPLPELTLIDGGGPICEGDSVALAVQVDNATSFSWSNGQATGSILVSPDDTTTYTATASNSCATEQVATTVPVSPLYDTNLELTVCPDETVGYAGVTLAPGDAQSFTLASVAGCDSVVNVTVAAYPQYEDSLRLQACTGASVTYAGTTLNPGDVQTFNFSTVNGCDSIITITVEEVPVLTSSLTLEACPGTTVDYNGTPLSPGEVQDFTFQSSNGCDSVVTVSVDPLPTFASDVTLSTCPGTTVDYNGTPLSPGDVQDFTLMAENGCDSVVTVAVTALPTFASAVELEACPGETVSYNGTPLSPGDVQDFTLAAENGCDSVVSVTVLELPTATSSVQLQACANETVTYNGDTLNPGEVRDFVFQAVNGCDSTVTVTVEELPTFTSEQVFQACPGDSVLYQNTALFPGDTTAFTLQAANGCDSVVTVVVEALPAFSSSLTLQSCPDEAVTYNGSSLNPGDTTTFVLSAENGCDSAVTVIVEALPTYASSLELEACANETVDYNGTALSPGDTLDFTFDAENGCDSVVTVFVTELPTFTSVQPLTACTGTTVDYNGSTLSPGDTADFTLQAANGCDSVVTVIVEELPTYESDLQLQACTGFTVEYNGVTLSPGDAQSFTLMAENGCDSIVNVTVEEVAILTSSVTLRACPGSSVDYNGTPLAAGETQDFTFLSESGCDSIVTVTVEPFPTYEEDLELTACSNETVTYNGNVLAPGEAQSFTLATANGCDSVVNVTVTELATYEQDLQLEACPGSTVTYGGTVLNPGDSQSFTFLAENGCDSVVNVSVLELPTFESDLTLQTCLGEPITYNGTTLQAGDQQSFTLAAANGCDSVVNVAVEGIEVFETELELQACAGTTVSYNGTTLYPGDQETFAFVSQIGCDSFVNVRVEELETYEQELEIQACEGTTVEYNGVTIAPGEQQAFVLAAENGCDSTVNVSIIGVENLFTNESRTICQGDSSIIFGNAEFTSGTYAQTFVSAQGCDSTHTVELTVAPLPQPSAEVQAACPGEPNGTAQISVSSGQPPYSFLWQDGAAGAERMDLPAGSYVLTVTDGRGCQSELSLDIQERRLDFEAEAQDISCFGEGDGLIQLSAAGSGLAYSIDGENFQSSSSFTGLEAGTYTAVVEDAFGCQFEQSGLVVNEPGQLLVQLPPDTSIQLGDSVLVNALVNTSDSLAFNWSPTSFLSCTDCRRPFARPLASTFVNVEVVTEDGCRAQDRMQLIVRKDRNVYIPNVFSPNGDGKNDVFYIYSGPAAVEIRSFQIFNRWGEPVFETFGVQPNDPEGGWDGRYRGEPMNAGVFAYFAEIEFIDGDVEVFKGDVLLMR